MRPEANGVVLNASPVLPKAGDLILYRCSGKESSDYKADQYKGSIIILVKTGSNFYLTLQVFNLNINTKQCHP